MGSRLGRLKQSNMQISPYDHFRDEFWPNKGKNRASDMEGTGYWKNDNTYSGEIYISMNYIHWATFKI